MADPVQLQRDGNLARDHADDGDRNGVWGDPFLAVVEELVVLPLGDIDPTGSAAHQHPGARLFEPQPGICPGFMRRNNRDE